MNTTSLSCDYEHCGSAFSLSDLPMHCEQCSKDFCFTHREQDYHVCRALPAEQLSQSIVIEPVAPPTPKTRKGVEIIDIPEPTLVEEEVEERWSWNIDESTARVWFVLFLGLFIVFTRYMLF